MIDATEIPEIPEEDIISYVREGKTHAYYGKVTERARKMRAWYHAQEYDHSGNNTIYGKTEIVKRSSVESKEDYDYKLDNLDLLPLEHKFLHTQQRIYDENNVQRNYSDFWNGREAHFDDQGDEVDVFFRDKVLFVKEVEGFGAVCLDLVTKNGKLLSDNGKSVPYPYVVQANEVMYFKTWHGHLQLLITSVKNEGTHEWRAFTPTKIYYFEDQKAQPVVIDHNFGQTPGLLLKGAVDANSGFKVGMPRRWNLTGLYYAASELFYDLKLGSKLFGHPIPAMPFDMLKGISGAYNEETEEFNASAVKEELGYVIGYDPENPPNKLFHQADMQGLQHLKSVIFEDIMNLIYQIAQVRDKSKVVHNSSGRSKQFDSVEEQGLLAQTATDMEAIERTVFRMMFNARGETFEESSIVYSKHHDLSSADEIWSQFVEGLQYGGVPTTTMAYLNSEFLRKRSAPQTVQDESKNEIETQGFPLTAEQIDALKDRVDNALLVAKVRPEIADQYEQLKSTLDILREGVLTNTNEDE